MPQWQYAAQGDGMRLCFPRAATFSRRAPPVTAVGLRWPTPE
jgi:hypothetical protein